MKKRFFSFLIIGIFILLTTTMCSKKKKIVVANVNGDKITLDEFNTRFEYYLKTKYAQNPELIPKARNSFEERKAVLRDMINERLIYDEAKKMKIDQEPEVKNLIKLYTRQIIINAYIDKYLSKDINVSDAEINEFYNKNKKYFKNADPDLARKQIKYQLTLKKYDAKIAELLDKLKNKYKIDENDDAIRPILSSPAIGETNKNSEGTSLLKNTPRIKIKK